VLTNPEPEDGALVRASGRLWLLTPRVSSVALREASAPPGGMNPRRVDDAQDLASIRRLFAKLEGDAIGGWISDDELTCWLEHNLERGRVTAFDVTPGWRIYEERFEARPRLIDLVAPAGLPTSPPMPLGPLEASSPEVARHRCAEVLHRASALMTRDTRREFDARLRPETFTRATAALWRWAGQKQASPTPRFDAPVFSAGYQFSGWPAFAGLDYLARSGQQAVLARNSHDLDGAAQLFVLAVETLGVTTFFVIAGLASPGGADTVNDQRALLDRWSAYVATLTLSAANVGRGAAWGQLSPAGKAKAVDLARRADRVTMADFLKLADFRSRFLAEFGPRPNSSTTRRILEMASRRFLVQLRGRVTLYVEGGLEERATSGASPGHAPPIAASAAADAKLLAGNLGPGATEVEIVDVGSSSAFVLGRDQAFGY
jgi:hypothetical protein